MGTPLISNAGRVFVRLPNGTFTYYGTASLAGLSKSFGESAPIYKPDPERAGRFIIDSRIPNVEEGFWTTTMKGRVEYDRDSKLAFSANNRCPIDIQVHYGNCNDPTDFADYDSAWLIEDARLSQYQTSALAALEPKDTAIIEETVNISASSAYRIINRKLESSGFVAENGVVTDFAICQVSCDDACDPQGCGRLYVLIVDNSPGLTSPPILHIAWSDDDGLTFYQAALTEDDVTYHSLDNYLNFRLGFTKDYLIVLNSVETGSDLAGILAIPHYTFVPSATSIAASRVDDGFIITGRVVLNGFTYYVGASGELRRIGNSLVSESIYSASSGRTARSVGALDGIDTDNIVYILKDTGTPVQYTAARVNGGPFVETLVDMVDANYPDFGNTTPIDSIAMLTQTKWLIGIRTGELLRTTDAGQTWHVIRQFKARVKKIEMVTKTVGYIVTQAPSNVYRTIDGGVTWGLVWAGPSYPIDDPASRITLFAIAACGDPNMFFVGGAKGGTNGLAIQTTITTTVLGYAAE